MLARALQTACLLLLACLGLCAAAAAQDHASGTNGAPGPAGQQGHDAHATPSTLDMPASEFFTRQFSHSVPYVVYEPSVSANPSVNRALAVHNVNVWQWTAVGLMALLFLPVVASFRKGLGAGWFTRVLRGFCLWIRDDMVYAVMGREEGRKFVPFFLFLFFFIAVQNVVGLIPSTGHAWPLAIYTATGTPWVTGALAAITFLLMLGFGMKNNGVVGFWKGLLPHGLPVALVPMMLVIELVGLVVKPFALTIRLFANMLAGHLVIASAIGLIFLFAKMQGGAITSFLTAIPCAGMAIFIYIIESFIVLLQAYIFTYLSIIFLHQAMHQEH